MSEYSELIKKFDKVRDYMRGFYVYGFKSREDFQKKSVRSYDNEKRRIEGYLSDIMTFRMDENGKNVFMSVDCADISQNPLYRAFKAKSFTKNDITLHFIILDILTEYEFLSAPEIANIIVESYLYMFENPNILDLSTIRNKLKEYELLGILQSQKEGKKQVFSKTCDILNICDYSDALIFFSEISPLGVVGSFALPMCNKVNTHFTFKHHYIMHALESEILDNLLFAIHNKTMVDIINYSLETNKEIHITITPLKFLVSTQGGRQYLGCYNHRTKSFINYRVDHIKEVITLEPSIEFDSLYKRFEEIISKTWGVYFGKAKHLETLTMLLDIPEKDQYVLSRLEREGRHGATTKINETTYKYEIEAYDTLEMIPWIRTFIGRIISLTCSNKDVVNLFYRDLDYLYDIYDGGDNNVI